MTSSDLEEQTLRLTVKLQAEEVEGGEGDEEIGGFINSDGEVFDWDDSEFFTATTTKSLMEFLSFLSGLVTMSITFSPRS